VRTTDALTSHTVHITSTDTQRTGPPLHQPTHQPILPLVLTAHVYARPSTQAFMLSLHPLVLVSSLAREHTRTHTHTHTHTPHTHTHTHARARAC